VPAPDEHGGAEQQQDADGGDDQPELPGDEDRHREQRHRPERVPPWAAPLRRAGVVAHRQHEVGPRLVAGQRVGLGPAGGDGQAADHVLERHVGAPGDDEGTAGQADVPVRALARPLALAERGGHERGCGHRGVGEDHAVVEQLADALAEGHVEHADDHAELGVLLLGEECGVDVGHVVLRHQRECRGAREVGPGERVGVGLGRLHHRHPG
jgi:hypothetical protein